MFIFVCGTHCSGKSSILSRLKEEGILDSIGNEIGKELVYSRNLNFSDTSKFSTNFDVDVTNLELEREKLYYPKNSQIGVETWHPGNLAYVLKRNPKQYDFLKKYIIMNSPFLAVAQGIYLKISEKSIITRTNLFQNNLKKTAKFFIDIDNNISICLDELNLTNRVFQINADEDFESVYYKSCNHLTNLR